ncbi:hypothetical protein [Patulibacter sp. SYSU D01012]|uniref:hypothetical protein n=1 Tax=Patulibacter sp. SYSU D01012 TaxID=2817381 RepID=UPI001B315053|nr:hypothetical protein [Patulibacter sp. SYSU D01012]
MSAVSPPLAVSTAVAVRWRAYARRRSDRRRDEVVFALLPLVRQALEAEAASLAPGERCARGARACAELVRAVESFDPRRDRPLERHAWEAVRAHESAGQADATPRAA